MAEKTLKEMVGKTLTYQPLESSIAMGKPYVGQEIIRITVVNAPSGKVTRIVHETRVTVVYEKHFRTAGSNRRYQNDGWRYGLENFTTSWCVESTPENIKEYIGND